MMKRGANRMAKGRGAIPRRNQVNQVVGLTLGEVNEYDATSERGAIASGM